MSNTCINCIHKDVCYKYRLNYVNAREGTCADFIFNDAPILEEKLSKLLLDIGYYRGENREEVKEDGE